MNNIGYIFMVRRLGKQSKLTLSRSDSISNLELNLRYMAHVAQMLKQEPIYKPSSIFCFKPILLLAHKLILLIYGDNRGCWEVCGSATELGRQSLTVAEFDGDGGGSST